MSTVTESDLQKLRDLIINNHQSLELGLSEMRGELKAINKQIQGLEKRVDDLNSRLNIITVGFLSILGVLVTGILGFIGKVVFFLIQSSLRLNFTLKL